MKQTKHFLWLLMLMLISTGAAWGEDYKLTIDASYFNTTSYAANNNEKTSTAVSTTDATKTFEVKWTSNQVMKNGTNMQWQKSNGYIFNSTDLGTIKSVNVTSSAGTFTTYYGTAAQPSSSTTVGNGYFQIKVGNATGYTSKVEVTFEKEEDSRLDPELSFLPSSAVYVKGETFTAPTLSNPHDLPVAYSSEDEEVATVTSAGVVTAVAAGTTNIFATFAGNETYKNSTVSYVLTVAEKPGAPTFVPATDSYVKLGSTIKITPNGNVDKLYFSINDGEYESRNTSSWNEITINNNMVTDAGTVTITAYHTKNIGSVVVTGISGTATYTLVDPKVTFDPTSTVFAGEQIQVTLAAEPEGAQIYYTTEKNGTPTTLYTEPIVITSTTTIKAVAKVGNVESEPASATYSKNVAESTSTGWVRIESTDDLDEAVENLQDVVITNHVVDGSKNIMAKTGNPGKNFTYTTGTTTDNGKYLTISNEDAAMIFAVDKDDNNNYLFVTVDNDNYAYLVSEGKTSLKLQQPSEPDYDVPNGALLDISFSTSGMSVYSFLKFINAYDNSNNVYLKYNSSNKLFSTYASGQQHPSLYRRNEVDAVTLYEKPSDFSVTSNTIEEKSGVTVNLYRSLSAGMWNAICLPFSMTDTQMKGLFGDTYSLQEFAGVETTNGATHLKFSEATSLVAGVPYIVNPSQNVEKNAVVVIRGVNITSTTPQVISKEGDEGDYTFQGIYNPYLLEKDNKRLIFIGRDNKFFYPTSTNPMMAFRAYFTFPEELSTAQMYLTTDEEGVADSISLTEVSGMAIHGSQRVYSVSGQLMGTSTEGLPKGIYIMNGKKFVVK